jgi:hypothetical protein
MSYGLDTEVINTINHSVLFNLPTITDEPVFSINRKDKLNNLLQILQTKIEFKDNLSDSKNFEDQLHIKELELDIRSIKEQIRSL